MVQHFVGVERQRVEHLELGPVAAGQVEIDVLETIHEQDLLTLDTEAVETLLLLPLGLMVFAGMLALDASHFTAEPRTTLLLVASGIVTAVPLLAFAGAARRLRLATVGFLMYINPTLQFLIALLVFREPLNQAQLTSFLIIWLALVVYSVSAYRSASLERRARV